MGHEKGCFKMHCRREQAAGGCCSAWLWWGGKGQQLFPRCPHQGCCWEQGAADTKHWEMGDWGSRHPFWLGTSREGWQGVWGCLLLHVHGVERATNPVVHEGTRTRTSKKQMFAGGNTSTVGTQEPEQFTMNFSCCSLGLFKWHAKISP